MEESASVVGKMVHLAGRPPIRGLREQVVYQIGVDIVAGRYPVGSLLLLDTEILERFSVSRTVAREAANALGAKGLIEARARTGTKVLPRNRWNLFDPDVLSWHFEAGPDAGFLQSLGEIRLAVELEAAALAAARRSDAQVEELITCLDAMSSAETIVEFALADLEFHRIIAEASANPFMDTISTLVRVALASAFAISSPLNEREGREQTIENHRLIADAIRDRRPEDARNAMRTVILEGVTRAIGRMPKPAADRAE